MLDFYFLAIAFSIWHHLVTFVIYSSIHLSLDVLRDNNEHVIDVV